MKSFWLICLTLLANNLIAQDYNWGVNVGYEYGDMIDLNGSFNPVSINNILKKTHKGQLGLIGDRKLKDRGDKLNLHLNIGLNLSYLHLDYIERYSLITNFNDPLIADEIPNYNYLLFEAPILFELRNENKIGFVVGLNNQVIIDVFVKNRDLRRSGNRYRNSLLFGLNYTIKPGVFRFLINYPTSAFGQDIYHFGLNLSFVMLLNRK